MAYFKYNEIAGDNKGIGATIFREGVEGEDILFFLS